jgi:uncharacterized iron-regulated protein
MLSFLALAVALAPKADEPDNPYQLNIGRPGMIRVAPGELMNMHAGRVANPLAVADMAKGKGFVYLGESHTSAAHHAMQADVIRALIQRGREVVIGVEMFTRPKQNVLDRWSLGRYTEEEFLEEADWKGQWGFDYALYRPIFEISRQHKLPMVALNVPRDWVRAVGQKGLDGLTEEARADLPEIYLGNKEHRTIFEAMISGHPVTGSRLDNMYAAQSLWDEGMADSAIRYFAKYPPNARTVFVVIAGSGHVMYGQGINWRIKRRLEIDGVTVTMVTGKEPLLLARGLGDFVYVSEE